MTKEKVETLMRERGATYDIVWRDNRKSTYQQVYDYLMKHPELRLDEAVYLGRVNDQTGELV